MQERSEEERRAIWLCLNVAICRKKRSDRATNQKYKPLQINQLIDQFDQTIGMEPVGRKPVCKTQFVQT